MCGELAPGGPPGKLQVQTAKVLLPVDEEDLLLEANIYLEPLGCGGRPLMWALIRIQVRARVWVWSRTWLREGVVEDMGKGMG
jgi:hypothetical protein